MTTSTFTKVVMLAGAVTAGMMAARAARRYMATAEAGNGSDGQRLPAGDGAAMVPTSKTHTSRAGGSASPHSEGTGVHHQPQNGASAGTGLGGSQSHATPANAGSRSSGAAGGSSGLNAGSAAGSSSHTPGSGSLNAGEALQKQSRPEQGFPTRDSNDGKGVAPGLGDYARGA